MAVSHFLRRAFVASPKLVPVIAVLFLLCACSESVTPAPTIAVQSPTIVEESTPPAHGQAGTVWAWGMNDLAQLGVAQAGQIARMPVNVQNLTDVTALITSGTSAFALREDGSVWGWGGSAYDALRGNYLNITQEPVQVPGFQDIESLFPGTGMVAVWAIDGSGQLWGWGPDDQTAWQVPGLNGVVKVADAPGLYPVMALLKDGTVWEDLCSTCAPDAIDGLQDIQEIAPHIALASSGKVWAVSLDGTALVKNLSHITHVYGSHWAIAYGLKNDGSLWAWPLASTDGQYAAEQVSISLAVTSVVAPPTGAPLVVTSDGTIWSLDGSDATEIQGLQSVSAYASMSDGNYETPFVIDDQGQLWAWGSNALGQLLDGTTNDSETPIKLPLNNIKLIADGYNCLFAVQG